MQFFFPFLSEAGLVWTFWISVVKRNSTEDWAREPALWPIQISLFSVNFLTGTSPQRIGAGSYKMNVFLSSLLCRVHFVMEKPDQNHVPVVFMLHLNFFMTVFSVCYTAVCFFLIATYLVRPYSTLPFLLCIFSHYIMHPAVGCSLFEMETCHDLDSGLDSLCLDWKVDRHTMGNN